MDIHVGLPQALYLFLILVGTVQVIAHHGEPEEGTKNAWSSIPATGLILFLLWWGGFFG